MKYRRRLPWRRCRPRRRGVVGAVPTPRRTDDTSSFRMIGGSHSVEHNQPGGGKKNK